MIIKNLRGHNCSLLILVIVANLSVLAPLALVFTLLAVVRRMVVDHVTWFSVHFVDFVEVCGRLSNSNYVTEVFTYWLLVLHGLSNLHFGFVSVEVAQIGVLFKKLVFKFWDTLLIGLFLLAGLVVQFLFVSIHLHTSMQLNTLGFRPFQWALGHLK